MNPLAYRIRKLLGKEEYYQCPYCRYVLPKKDATVSGYDSQSSLRYVHCPRCGKIITHTPQRICEKCGKVIAEPKELSVSFSTLYVLLIPS